MLVARAGFDTYQMKTSQENNEKMRPLYFNDAAQALLARRLRRRPDAALRLDLLSTYSRSMGYSYLALRWTRVERAERDGQLLRCGSIHQVPIFMTPRLLRYLMWHPLRVQVGWIGPFSRLIPAADPLFADQLRLWERLHPSIELPMVAAA